MEKQKKKGGWKQALLIVGIVLGVLVLAFAALVVVQLGYFLPGNAAKYAVSAVNTVEPTNEALSGKTIIFLGSSVTDGMNAHGESFVDFLAKRDGVIPVKEAVSGTTLVTTKKNSYIERMKTIDTSMHADAFVCQLSTNDATINAPLGTVSTGTELTDFDTTTVAGAIEYIVCYAKQTWNCPVIFYTGTKYGSEAYGDMVDLLLKIQQKWDIGVLDLWNDADMSTVSAEDYALYILVAIAVNEDGYREILGAAEGMKEDKASWTEFFKWLKNRGLEGVRLIVGDKCLGMLEAVGEVFPEAKYQRCTVHFYRNVFSVVSRSKGKVVAKMLKAIHAQESKEAAKEKARSVVAALREMKLKEAAVKVENSIEETLIYMDFPYEHWTRIRTNNAIERLNREIRSRTRVVGTFPDGNSALMLVCARLRHVAGTQWGNKKYMNMKHLENTGMMPDSIAG